MERTQKPELEIKAGNIQASAWKNETEGGESRYNISLSRFYKDRQNRWQRTTSFRKNDLPALGEVVAKLQAEFEERIRHQLPASGAISGTILTNDSAYGQYFTGTITRFYNDERGQQCRAKTFRPQDLNLVADVVSDLKQKMTLLVSQPESLRPPKFDPRGELPKVDDDIDIFSELEFTEELQAVA